MSLFLLIAGCLAVWTPPSASLKPGPPPIERQVDNLIALSKLHRLVRFYHPSRTAVDLNWNDRLLQAIAEARSAADDDALGACLQRFVNGIGPPEVRIERTAGPPQPGPNLLRTGPLVEAHGKVLYAALSSGDCCRPAIEFIEEHTQRQSFESWVLDLRHTSTRSWGSIFTEAKVTLAWALCGSMAQPPHIGRILRGWHSSDDGRSRQVEFAERPSLSATGPDLLGHVPLLILVDETTHPAAGGWVLAAQVTGRATVAGSAFEIQAEQPFEVQLSGAFRALLPLSAYAVPKTGEHDDGMLHPDLELPLPAEATPAQIIDLLVGLALPPRTTPLDKCNPDENPLSPDMFSVKLDPLADGLAASPDSSQHFDQQDLATLDLLLAHAILVEHVDFPTQSAENELSALRRALSSVIRGDNNALARMVGEITDGNATIVAVRAESATDGPKAINPTTPIASRICLAPESSAVLPSGTRLHWRAIRPEDANLPNINEPKTAPDFSDNDPKAGS